MRRRVTWRPPKCLLPRLPDHVRTEMAAKKGGFPEMRNRRLKEEAVAFYSRHSVPEELEKLLNEMVHVNPPDVYGYMSEYFQSISVRPVVSRVVVREVLDASASVAVQVELHCIVNGVEKHVSTAAVSLELRPAPPDGGRETKTAQPASTGGDQEQRYVDAFRTVRQFVDPALKSQSPCEQKAVDQALSSLQLPQGENEEHFHPSSLLAVSSAVAIAGASLLKTPLYLHLNKSCDPQTKFSMPIPITSCLVGAAGKLKMREVCLTPLQGSPFVEQVKMLTKVHRELGKVLAGKFGVSGKAFLSNGCYCPTIDKPEQALDWIQEASKQAGLELGQNVAALFDVGADMLYDEDKGKYEIIAGQWKTTDDVINLYCELVQSSPGLLGFIDALHHKDVDGWRKLCERLGSKCLLVADRVLEKGLPLSPAPFQGDTEADGATHQTELGVDYLSCATVPLQSTLSGTIDKANDMKSRAHYVMLRVPPKPTMNLVYADLAVAMQCRFIRMAAPSGVTSSGTLSRLLLVREELAGRKMSEPGKAHLFTSSRIQADNCEQAKA